VALSYIIAGERSAYFCCLNRLSMLTCRTNLHQDG
jgi:hypothetical protein